MMNSANRHRPWVIYGLLGVVGFLAAQQMVPVLARLFPPCQFHEWTGWHCPGCGGTRCVLKLLRGDVLGALAMNALVVLYLGCAVCWLAVYGWRRVKGARTPEIPKNLGWYLGGGVIVFWVLRNIPSWPFTLLAPHV